MVRYGLVWYGMESIQIEEGGNVMSNQNQERQIRNALRKAGFLLVKSHAKVWSLDDMQEYKILDGFSGNIVSGEGFNLTLEDAMEFLEED